MKRIITFVLSTAMAVGLFATAAVAGGHEWHDDVPRHGHVMLVGAEVDATGTLTFRNCVEFKSLRTPAHHHSIHTGVPGGSPFAGGPLFQAGNWVIPLSPFAGLPFTGCESFESGMKLPS